MGGQLGPDTAEPAAIPGPDDGGLFTAVSLGRASQAIVEQIRALLHEGRLVPGDRLPSERELGQRFGVSRVTVREALRILETAGLIAIKVGARGGAFVTSPTSDQVGAGLADLLTLSPMTAAEVTEARLVFEIGIVPLVVDRATDADISALRELTDEHARRSAAGEYTMEMSADFHVAVAGCTHNSAVAMLVQSFHGPLLMSLREARTIAPEMGAAGVTEHAAFVDAIAARDVDAARTVMLTHLRRTQDRVRA
ncbi:MAG TPA: FadR/GntR family transcriptional regulator [Pseudonocardiaceae bacterium]|nr:FadR/GntR family transcriptional regulator [Pseudonocardiaceae bacterium]